MPVIRPPIDLWQPAHTSRWRSGRLHAVDWLVWHATSGRGDARATAARWATAPKPHEAPTCAHFAIGQDGFVVQVVHIDDTAQHAHAASDRSVGIELCAREPGEFGPDDPGLPPSPAQLERSVELGAWLCRRLGLAANRTRIRGHAEVDRATTHTGCPTAAGVDLDALAADVAARLAV